MLHAASFAFATSRLVGFAELIDTALDSISQAVDYPADGARRSPIVVHSYLVGYRTARTAIARLDDIRVLWINQTAANSA
jgi:hypothetical protein